MRRWAAAILLLLVACGGSRPSRAEWTADVWVPMRDAVPVPTEATAAACDEALGVIRAVSETLLSQAREIGERADIAYVATNSAQDQQIGELIAEAFDKVG